MNRSDVERGNNGIIEFVSTGEKVGYGVWGFFFGLVLGLIFGSIPLCILKNKDRKKSYMIGWIIGVVISISVVVTVMFLAPSRY